MTRSKVISTQVYVSLDLVAILHWHYLYDFEILKMKIWIRIWIKQIVSTSSSLSI